MSSFSVVEYFYVIEQAMGSFRPAEVPIMVYPFGFKQPKEAFRNSFVITVFLAAHTASDAMLGKDFLIIAGSVLAAPIRMMNRPLQEFGGQEPSARHQSPVGGSSGMRLPILRSHG